MIQQQRIDLIVQNQWKFATACPKNRLWAILKSNGVKLHPFLYSEAIRVILSAFAKLVKWLLTTPQDTHTITKKPTPTPAITKTKALPTVKQLQQKTTRAPTTCPPTIAENRTSAPRSLERQTTIPSTALTPTSSTSTTTALSTPRQVGQRHPKQGPTTGLPNFQHINNATLGSIYVANVCYINAAVQMIANIPQLESLIQAADVSNSPKYTQRLKGTLTALLRAMQTERPNQENVRQIYGEFWRTLQISLRQSPLLGLNTGTVTNCPIELLAYLGRELNIPKINSERLFQSGIVFNQAQAIGATFTNPNDDPGDVLIATIDNGGGLQPRPIISVNNNTYQLKGIINYTGTHYTATVRARDGNIYYHDDERRTPGSAPRNRFRIRGVVYEKVVQT